MESNWPIVRIGDIAESISITHSFGKEQLIFLNTSDIANGKVLHNTYSHIEHWPGQAKKSIQRGDILFSEIRPANGRYAFVDFDADDYVVSTKLMVIRAKNAQVNPKYLYIFLTNNKVTSWLQHLAESRSGTFPQITFDQVSSLEIPLPPKEHQEKIANIISAIDDKIELSHHMNKTLEASARVIFQSWFVNFDPVRAKAEGRQPFGMDSETAALFADSFEESELGQIPKGWDVRAIGDLVDAVGGATPSTKESSYWDGKISFATPKDMSSLSAPILLGTERHITEEGVEQIGSGILPKGTVLLSSRAPIGYLAIANIPVAVNQGVIAMICNQELPNYFVLNWTAQNMETIIGRANGTTFLEISKKNFRPIKVVVPPAGLLQRFTEIVEPLYNQITMNLKESQTLMTLRDTLLPKLLSGEVQLGNIVST